MKDRAFSRFVGRVSGPALTMLAVALVIAGTILTLSCGGGLDSANPAPPPAGVTVDDVERGLKFDSRVKDFETDGDKLVVNVNDYWITSPSGIQERAVQKWFSQWQSARADEAGKPSKSTEVVVKYEGDDVAHATMDKGVQILGKSAQKTEGT